MTMKRIPKRMRPLYLIVMFFAFLSLSGCWSADEINDLTALSVIGIDENNAGQVEVTSVIVRPESLFSQTAVSGKEQSNFLVETTTGESIFEAISDLSSTVSETLYFGHVDAIVFGERAARERMLFALDFFKRQNDFRPNTQLLVTQGTASKLVKTMPQENVTLGLELSNLVLSNRFAATSMVNDISQFIEALSSNTTDPITGVISTAEKQGVDIHKNKPNTKNQSADTKDESETTDNTVENGQQKVPKALSLKETAVFKGGQLKGFLNEKETRGLLWIKGKLQNDVMVLNCGQNKGGTVSLNITNSESQLTPRISGGTTQMTINVEVEADISQVTCTDFNMNTHQIDRLNQQLEGLVRQEAADVLNKAKNQWQTDVFGFGQTIHRQHPDEWKQMAPKWRNGLLKNVEVDLSVSANISRYGLLKDPSKANEGE